MTLAALRSFTARLAADPALRDKVHAANGLDEVVAIAAEQGDTISKTTLLREQARAVAETPDHHLEGINSWADALMVCFGATDKD
ncbi:Nif11-like leader peptide family natural product precursor [Synechococcus sp. CCY9201]|jgi:predicted ribosomally synthesized peptide with nif11-like leader|uniref:Nif11-like leader peptide family natural product precursor n=1 Tax=unclassified Synechococcus TaxID=2626047 RepID=UPI0018CD61D8|nr:MULTISPECIES: Nif11-like leader peptide family natural product precursor [unclassified Synechococcus]MCT0225279.1 Nif11-like leader peptide family natural product precursor [Synechococcus sp. CS-1328]MEA5422778.1 Nif11-like leader peptide family natural product precursor [Synechococcus sp. CCY9202]MEA5475432.1 Nif11-like leader peptide family natural product precursor [Synechococcus sp. CCY9201]QPN59885.1 Nif11-like leader peptide family natural product precursor [Synechococcus sp. CBW1002]